MTKDQFINKMNMGMEYLEEHHQYICNVLDNTFKTSYEISKATKDFCSIIIAEDHSSYGMFGITGNNTENYTDRATLGSRHDERKLALALFEVVAIDEKLYLKY